MRRRIAGSTALIALAALVVLKLVAPMVEGDRPTPLDRSNLVLVVVDTLRSDLVGSYGGPSTVTPFFDEIAAAGVRFEDVTSPSSQTVPSVVSMLTGVYPHRHGNQYFPETVSFRRPQRLARPSIPVSIRTVPQRLQEAGLSTAAIVTNPWLREEYGFSRGFAEYRYLRGRSFTDHPRGDLVNETARGLLDDGLESDRFFLYLHYMDVHPPFDPSEASREAFTRGLPGKRVRARNRRMPNVSDADFAYMRALYTAAVRDLDDTLRGMAALLAERDLAERTLVVIVSDHGEEFGEHGGIGHGFQLFEEVTRVPLVFSHPALSPATLRAPVSGVDLAPTLLELMGLPVPDGLDGISLAPWIRGTATTGLPRERILLAELGTLVSARQGRRKLIRSTAPDDSAVAFVLAADGTETRGESADRRWSAALSERVDRILDRAVAPPGPPRAEISEDPDFEKRLRALGYAAEPR